MSGNKYFKRTQYDLIKFRHYLKYSVTSTLQSELSNTFLGYLWWLLDPLLHMIVYTFLVSFIFKKDIPAFPVYVFCALLPWKLFTGTLNVSTSLMRRNAAIIRQVYLPKFLLPLSLTLANLIKLLVGYLVLFSMILIYHIALTWHVIEIVPVLISFVLFTYGLSLFILHLGLLFDDTRSLLTYILLFWFFCSPSMWHLDMLKDSDFSRIIWINPMVAFFESFRNVMMYGRSPYYGWLGLWLLVSVILICLGIPMLYRNDKNYGKVI